MIHHKYKKFERNRLVYMGEVPKFGESDVESVKKMKEEEGEELDTAGLVSEVNSAISAHSEQIKQLPPAFSSALRREIQQYLTASPGRYEQDKKKGLSAKEFASYRGAMVKKVKDLLAQHVPTEEQIKKRKESREKASAASGSAEKIKPLDMKAIKESPGEISDVGVLNTKFKEYNGWNMSLQKEGSTVLSSTSSFQKSCAAYMKSRNGLKAYKKFGAYLWPEDDSERLNLQSKLNAAKKKVADTIDKYKTAKKRLKKYGEEMSEASNRLKAEKMKERDARLKKIEEEEEKRGENKEEKEKAYNSLEKRQKAMIEQRDKLEEYQKKAQKSTDRLGSRLKNARNKKGELEEFHGTTKAAIDKINEAMKDPNLSEAAREYLEKQKTVLTQKSTEASAGIEAADVVIENGGKKAAQLGGEKQKMALRSLKLKSHLDTQVHPTLMSLNSSIALLEATKLEFATSKDQIMKHYEDTFKSYDAIDAAVDGAVASYNLGHEKMLGFLNSQQKALGKINLNPPKGVSGAFEATVGIPLEMAGGGITALGEGIVDQAKWLSQSLENARSEMGDFSYAAARLGVEIISVPIGVAGGLVELGGGLVTMAASPIDTVKGMAPLVGLSDEVSAGEAWSQLGKSLIAWEDFKKGRIGLGIGKVFTNIVTTITGAGAVGAGGKAAATAFKAARVAGRGVALASAKAGVAFVAEAGVFVAKEFRAGGVQAVMKFARAPGRAKDIARYALARVKELGGGASAKSLAMQKLALRLRDGAGRYEEFQQALQKMKQENPKLSNKELRAKLRHENPKLHADGLLFEENLAKFTKASEEMPVALTKKRTPKEEEPLPLTRRKGEEPIPLTKKKAKPVPEETPTGAKTPEAKRTAKAVPEEVPTGAGSPQAKRAPTGGLEEPPTAVQKPKVRPPEEVEAARTAAINKLNKRLEAHPPLAKKIDAVLERNKMGREALAKLEPEEVKLLANSGEANLSETAIEKIIKREFHEITDAIDGKPATVRVYMDDSSHLGAGGLGSVKEGYVTLWEHGGELVAEPRLKKAAIKVEKPGVGGAGVDYMRQNEIDTLRAIRDMPNQEGLLKPLFVGEKEGQVVIATEAITPHPGAENVALAKVVNKAPIEETLQYLSDSMSGLDKLHATGRAHMDIKFDNIFAGSVEGTRVGVMGDLAAMKFDDLASIRITKGVDPQLGDIAVIERVLPNGDTFQIPSTPTAMGRAYNHVRAAQEWLLAHPGQAAPQSVRALPDLGQLAYSLDKITNFVKGNSYLLPKGYQEKVVGQLNTLVGKIDDVPDFDALNAAIETAAKADDATALKYAQEAKEAALAQLEKSTLTAKDVQMKLDTIVDGIKEAGGGRMPDEAVKMRDAAAEAPTGVTEPPPAQAPPDELPPTRAG